MAGELNQVPPLDHRDYQLFFLIYIPDFNRSQAGDLREKQSQRIYRRPVHIWVITNPERVKNGLKYSMAGPDSIPDTYY
jgi:hypothetical protein